MKNHFDQLTKGLAQSVTRRAALKKFGVGLAGMALACFGLVNRSEAGPKGDCGCTSDADCRGTQYCSSGVCLPKFCRNAFDICCCYRTQRQHGFVTTAQPPCSSNYSYCLNYCAFVYGP